MYISRSAIGSLPFPEMTNQINLDGLRMSLFVIHQCWRLQEDKGEGRRLRRVPGNPRPPHDSTGQRTTLLHTVELNYFANF